MRPNSPAPEQAKYGIPLSARQNRTSKSSMTTEGASQMIGFKHKRKVAGIAGVVLLLIVVMSVSMSAQSLNPVPFPTPAAVPPPNAVIPAFQTRPAGVLLSGQIQYASLDSSPGLCNKEIGRASCRERV